MALKKRNKAEAGFNMSSMTDMIFLLLLFFMIAATMSAPNDIKISLPQSRSKSATKATIVRIGIDKNGEFSFSKNKSEAPKNVLFEEIEPLLSLQKEQDSTFYIALYADENAPYRDVVRILDIANSNHLKMVIATKVKEN